MNDPRNPHVIDHHVSEKEEIFTAMQCFKASDPALDDADTRAALQKILGIKPKAAIIDARYPAIPESPIRSTDVLISYLSRGYTVQCFAPSTTAPTGRLWQPLQINEVKSSTFNTGNIPSSASIGLAYERSLVLEFDTSTISDSFETFVAKIDPLTGVPVICGSKAKWALVITPPGFRILSEKLASNPLVKSYTLSKYKRIICPPSFDRDANGLKLLTWLDEAHTVPILPSANLLQHLTTSAVLEKTMPEPA